MTKGNVAGLWFLVLLFGFSVLPLLEQYGTWLENLINGVLQLTTIMVMALLFEKWVYGSNKKTELTNAIAIAHVIITVINPMHMMIEYSEQTMPSGYLFISSLEFLMAIAIAKTIIKV